MALSKLYSRINWENEPSTKTPLNETNLNKIDLAIDEIDNRVISLDTTKATKVEVSELKGDLGELLDTDSTVIKINWVQGNLNNGVYTSTDLTRICTSDYISNLIQTINANGYDIGFVIYDSNNSYVTSFAWYNGIINIGQILGQYKGYNVKLVARYNNNNISPTVADNFEYHYPFIDLIDSIKTSTENVKEENDDRYKMIESKMKIEVDNIEWEYGGINTSGNNVDSTTRIRTKSYLPLSTSIIKSINSSYQFIPMIYDVNGTYLGTPGNFISNLNVSDLYDDYGDSFKIRLVGRNAQNIIYPYSSCFYQIITTFDLSKDRGFWKNRSVLHIGTSISDESVLKISNGIGYYVNRWVQNGLAINGCYNYHNTSASGKGAQWFAQNYSTLIEPYISDCYLLTIEHGENDAYGERLGTIDDMNPDSNGNYNLNTFYGAMAYIITRSRSLNMYVKIGLVGSWYKETREIVRNVANKFNLPILDMYKTMGSSDQEIATTLTLQDGTVVSKTQSIRKWFSTYIGTTDGDSIHPYNPLAQEKLATSYANWINTI